MSFKLSIDCLEESSKRYIEKTLVVETQETTISIFDMDQQNVFLPFAFARGSFDVGTPEEPQSEPSVDFKGQLRPHQKIVRDKCFEHLEMKGSVIMAAQPGFGKTITSIEMLCSINQKTLIMVKQTMIMNQWMEALAKYAPSKKVQKITSSKPLDPEADVYLVNPVILKTESKARVTRKDLECVKLLIVDEMHQIVSKVLLRSFFKVQPAFLIGLSATPRRPKNDPFQNVIAWFFGDAIVGTPLFRNHTVYTVTTGFTPPEIKYTMKGLDWNHILTEQAESTSRNVTIVKTVMRFPERVWLVLVKRVDHAERLKALFDEHGVDCDTLTGSKTTFDHDCKILIGTTSKIGVGFDHAPIDALCVAADVVEYFEQFLGRCMRRVDNNPIVVDFDDDFATLHKHFMIRLKEYTKHGGVIASTI